MWTKHNLLDLIHSKLGDYKFILVSNREPYVHRRTPGATRGQPGDGRDVSFSAPTTALPAINGTDPVRRSVTSVNDGGQGGRRHPIHDILELG